MTGVEGRSPEATRFRRVTWSCEDHADINGLVAVFGNSRILTYMIPAEANNLVRELNDFERTNQP